METGTIPSNLNKRDHFILGRTLSGRMLVVILGPTEKADIWYPITARPASTKERRLY